MSDGVRESAGLPHDASRDVDDLEQVLADLCEPGYDDCPVQLTYGQLHDRLLPAFSLIRKWRAAHPAVPSSEKHRCQKCGEFGLPSPTVVLDLQAELREAKEELDNIRKSAGQPHDGRVWSVLRSFATTVTAIEADNDQEPYEKLSAALDAAAARAEKEILAFARAATPAAPPTRCPTCGGDNPRVRHSTELTDNVPCPDTWHGASPEAQQ